MITPQELRIGNWVNIEGLNVRVVDILCDSVNTMVHEGATPDYIKPIELTPEILDKCGFVGHGEMTLYLKNDSFTIENFSDGYCYTGGEGCSLSVPILYLHQLQNMVFAICGQELNVEL